MVERTHWLALMLMAVIVALYSNALHTPFQFDDYNVIVTPNGVHSWTAWLDETGHGLRPLLKLSYTLNWSSGVNTWGFHVFNVLLHIGNCLLLYALVRHICITTGRAHIANAVAMLTVALFALHPAHTEAVTYISGRSTSLMTFFYLAGLLAYTRGRERNHGIRLYLFSPVLFLLAVASKETAVTLPCALVLLERCLYPSAHWRAVWRKQAVHWCMLLVVALLFLMQDRYWKMLDFSANLRSLSDNFYTQLHAMSYLLGQLLWPVQMNIDPDLEIRTSWWSVWPDMVGWSMLSGLVLWLSRRNILVLFAYLWLLLQLFPIYVFLPRLDVANDRQLYLADWPVLMLIALGVMTVLTQVRWRALLIAVLLIFGAGATWLRNQDYRSEITLWESTVRASPHKARPQNNLGYAYFLDGRIVEAELAYRAALEIDPDFWRAENNLLRLHENRQ